MPSTAATPARSLSPSWGDNCPDPQALQTGDLLFPRQPSRSLPHGSTWLSHFPPGGLATSSLRPTLREILNRAFTPDGTTLLEKMQTVDGRKVADMSHLPGYTPDPSLGLLRHIHPAHAGMGQSLQPVPTYTSLLHDPQAAQTYWSNQGTAGWGGGGFPGPDDPEFLYAMLAILRIEFPELIGRWLKMSIDDFVSSDIGRFFMDALTSTDVRLSFFVGHVGLVLREQKGRSEDRGGKLYVIECNITDYSHYRVAIHPYYDPADPNPDAARPMAPTLAARMRGWANRRCALGEYVWSARPDWGPPDAEWKTRLLRASQSGLGRPYGFFDHPTFGNDDRLYCSEYVFRVFDDINPAFAHRLQERRTWGSMQAYLKASGQTDQLDLIRKIMRDRHFGPDRSFFVLPPALLWGSSALTEKTTPRWDVQPYAPVV